jgi:ABC-type Na+ efflux pump permease subunit
MKWRSIHTVAKKDITVVARNKGVIIPLIIVPLFFFVLLPWGAAFLPSIDGLSNTPSNDSEALMEMMPEGLVRELEGLNPEQKMITYLLVYMLAPMFLIVPLMVSSVIAADSFAGEKERKTMEALLFTPITDRELFVGKLLAAWVPAQGVALLGFILYSFMVNLAAGRIMGGIFFPNLMWVVLIILVVPPIAGLGLMVMVMVSARAQGFQDAYQIGAVVVLPVVMLVMGQAFGLLYFNLGLVVILGLVLWIVDGILLWMTSRSFSRDQLIARISR